MVPVLCLLLAMASVAQAPSAAPATPPAAAAPAAPAAPPPAAEQIAAAVLAAPADRRAGAGVLGYDDKGALVTLREGTNDQVCLADNPRDKGFSVACYHKDLEPFMARGRAMAAEGRQAGRPRGPAAKEIAAGTLKMPREPRIAVRRLRHGVRRGVRHDRRGLHALGGLHALRHAGVDRAVAHAGARRALADVSGQGHRAHHDQSGAAAQAVANRAG